MNLSFGFRLFVRLLLAVATTAIATTHAQVVNLPRASPRAGVSQVIGITKVSVEYGRPSVNGREVWGQLVPYGFSDLGYGTNDQAPWRAGADQNTVITFEHDVTVGDQPVPAGAYGLHMAIAESGEVTVILSKNADAWGSFFYDPALDAARVTTHWEDAPHEEMLSYAFSDVTKTGATLALRWESKRIPFPITVDTDAIVVASLTRDLTSGQGFDDRVYIAASNYLVQNNLDLELALTWAERAVSPRTGQPSFNGFAQQALVLDKLGRTEEALAVMARALPLGTPGQIHQYGRSLLAAQQPQRALEVFQTNARLHPDTWPVNYGLARGYSAVGDYAAALEALLKARDQVPEGDTVNGPAIEANLEKLRRGEDIN